MTIEEVKKEIGEENWEAFLDWMQGQTVGCKADGTINYFECDVRDFKTKLLTGKDRQTNPLTWD